MKLQREYMKQEGERIDFTNAGLRSREVMLRYNQIEPASQKFDALHSAEMWARFQFLLYNFNTSYLGQLVPVLMYALCMVVMGKEAVSKDSGVKIGDVVLVLSTLSGFSSSIASLANRLVKVGRGFLGVEILAEFLNQPSILDATLLATRLDSSLHASMSTLTQDEQNENALLHQTLCVDQEHQPLNEQEIVVKDAMFDVDLKTEGIQSYGFNLVLKQGSFSLLLGAEGSGESALATPMGVDNAFSFRDQRVDLHLLSSMDANR
jgi:ABC-type multidrug transport system fused ATPase/permease subunit